MRRMRLFTADLNHKLKSPVVGFAAMISRLNSTRGKDTDSTEEGLAAAPVMAFNRALVVGKSPVNRVVVSKIAERSGLKPISESPETAIKVLRSFVPGVVVLDGGADNRDCEGLIAQLVALRRMTGKKAPCVILLSTSVVKENELMTMAAVDAVVVKPITTEQLQPLIERLLERLRG